MPWEVPWSACWRWSHPVLEVLEFGRGQHPFGAMFDSGLPALNQARVALGLGPFEHVGQFQAAQVEFLMTSRAFDFPSDSLPALRRSSNPPGSGLQTRTGAD